MRVESGVINESIYRTAILDDPANPVSDPWSPGGKKPGPGWNGKLFYHFLGGCGPGFRSGRNVATSAINISDTVSNRDEPIRLGFAARSVTQHAGDRLRRHRVRRDGRDDQGALHRAVRTAEIHDRPGSSVARCSST